MDTSKKTYEGTWRDVKKHAMLLNPKAVVELRVYADPALIRLQGTTGDPCRVVLNRHADQRNRKRSLV